MNKPEDYIWYASYGSNLLEERFHCYIQGGKPKGSTKQYKGCKNKNLPIDSEETYITSELYFAKESETWNGGGVCFISNDFNPKSATLARMYLITKEQFVDVVKQEIGKEDFEIDFERAISDGSNIFRKNSWYNKIHYLGIQNNFPIFTFTHDSDYKEENKPDINYLKIIIEGIKETFQNFNEVEIADYLISKRGISGNFNREALLEIVSDK